MVATSEMRIKDYESWVHLGCTKDEQVFKQPVWFNVEILFNSEVAGEKTDHLHDTIDYVELTNRIRFASEKKPYHLIEHMCLEVTQHLQEYLLSRNFKGSLTVRLLKKRAPIPYLVTGVEWTCRAQI